MKKLLLALLAVTACLNEAISQESNYIKKPALGITFFFNDFESAANVKQNGLSNSLRDRKFGKLKEMSPGLAVNYVQGLTNHIDITANLGGSFVDYPIANRSVFANDNFLLEGDLSINAKMFTDNYWFSPFVTAGIGGSKYKGYYGAIVPVGFGVQLNIIDEAYVLVNAQYRLGITDNTTNHFYFGLGIVGSLGKKN
ncbi:MAG: hypothetical protein H7Y27_01185 [Gemmatimonadaceae bacterium]|nr:hypothetical protein [Chitinophagaceae bacterium]